MLRDRDLRDLAGNAFELRCGALSLHATGAPGDSCTGVGYIRQAESGDLSLVMFIVEGGPSLLDFFDDDIPAGSLYSDGDYYTLEACDYSGRVWTASRVRPRFTNFEWRTRKCRMAEATLKELQGEETTKSQEGPSRLDLWYRGDVEVPFHLPVQRVEKLGEEVLKEGWSVAAAKFNALGCRFSAHLDSPLLWISASSSEPHLPANLEERVTEALEFLSARRLSWMCAAKREAGTLSWRLTGAPANRVRGRMQPPVPFRSGVREECEPARELLERFLSHIGGHEGDKRPDLSTAVRVALEGSYSPLDAHALDLSVAVESVLASEFEAAGRPEKTFLDDLKRARAALSSLKIAESSKRRIDKLLASVGGTSAKSRLLDLERQGMIGREDVKAWENIRHKLAHGKLPKAVDQDYVDDFWRLMTLFYKLIFAAVGYTGSYRDYGERGWPWAKTGG